VERNRSFIFCFWIPFFFFSFPFIFSPNKQKNIYNVFFPPIRYVVWTQCINLVLTSDAVSSVYLVSFSNRAAALLQLDKLNKALDDAEMTVKLKPQWEKVNVYLILLILDCLDLCNTIWSDAAWIHFQGYFRKGSILEAMKRYDDVCIK